MFIESCGKVIDVGKHDHAKTDELVNEDAEWFIGPKLPPRMTKEEIDAFYIKIIAKFKLDDK